MKKAHRGCYRILKNEEIAPDIYELCFEAREIANAATAGQFVNVYLPGGALLLPRPISIADAHGDHVTLVYQAIGAGTRTLSDFSAGGTIEVMGPLGAGFFDYEGSLVRSIGAERFAEPSALLLIGGGVGIPPLHFAARRAREVLHGHVVLYAFLGYRAYPWYLDEFRRICDEVEVASEAAGAAAFQGNVLEPLEHFFSDESRTGVARPALALTCGPRPMLEAVSGWCTPKDIPLRVSLEERMGCGYGACAGCTCKTRPLDDKGRPQNGPVLEGADGIVKKKVCVHGPVFWENEVVW